jgi:hypothetical protein
MSESQPPKKPQHALPEIFDKPIDCEGYDEHGKKMILHADTLLPPEQIAKNIAEHEAYRKYEQEQKAKGKADRNDAQEP